MIACSREINNICYNPKTIKYRNYANYSPEELKSDVVKINWSPAYNATDVDLTVHHFLSSLQLVFETHAWKTGEGKPCPWLGIDTKKLMNRRDQTLRQVRIRPWETNVIKRLRKRNQSITKIRSMITLINQRNFGHKSNTFFLENHNQWQTYQLINVLVLTYFYRAWCKSGTRTPGPGTSKFKSGTPGLLSKFKKRPT